VAAPTGAATYSAKRLAAAASRDQGKLVAKNTAWPREHCGQGHTEERVLGRKRGLTGRLSSVLSGTPEDTTPPTSQPPAAQRSDELPLGSQGGLCTPRATTEVSLTVAPVLAAAPVPQPAPVPRDGVRHAAPGATGLHALTARWACSAGRGAADGGWHSRTPLREGGGREVKMAAASQRLTQTKLHMSAEGCTASGGRTIAAPTPLQRQSSPLAVLARRAQIHGAAGKGVSLRDAIRNACMHSSKANAAAAPAASETKGGLPGDGVIGGYQGPGVAVDVWQENDSGADNGAVANDGPCAHVATSALDLADSEPLCGAAPFAPEFEGGCACAHDDVACTRCHSRAHEEEMLLCDSCNAGYHLFCLEPPLKSIPAGDWFCGSCSHESAAASQRRHRRVVELDCAGQRGATSSHHMHILDEEGSPDANARASIPPKVRTRTSDVLAPHPGGSRGPEVDGDGWMQCGNVLQSDSDEEPMATGVVPIRRRIGSRRQNVLQSDSEGEGRSPSTDLEVVEPAGPASVGEEEKEERGDREDSDFESDGEWLVRKRRRSRHRGCLQAVMQRTSSGVQPPTLSRGCGNAQVLHPRKRCAFLDDAAEGESGSSGDEEQESGPGSPELQGFIEMTQAMTQRTPATDEQAMYMRSLRTPVSVGSEERPGLLDQVMDRLARR
jgi:hypothetical protein